MNGIIKRRKTSDYAQIHNGALQQLEDIKSIGLIAHLMSLPDTWEIKKTALYNKFGRGPTTTAIKELEGKKYWVTIKYRKGKENLYYYNVSDVAFADGEVLNMIDEVNQEGDKIIEISESFAHLISIGGNQQLKTENHSFMVSSNVGFEQCKINITKSNVENVHLLNKSKEINSNKLNNIKETSLLINNPLTAEVFQLRLTYYCNEFYTLFAPNRWDKKSWNSLITAFVTETINEGRHRNIPEDKIKGYAYKSLKNIAYNHDSKNGKVERKFPFYDWLNEDSEEEMPY